MKVIEGNLKRLGEGTVDNKFVKYSLIQIADKTITSVYVARKLNNFLTDGIDSVQPTKLWMASGFRKEVMAVQVGDDARYYSMSIGRKLFYAAVHFTVSLMFYKYVKPSLGLGLAVFGLWFYGRPLLDCFRVAGAGGTSL